MRAQRGEGIIADLCFGVGQRIDECRFSGIGQAEEPGIGNELQAQPDPSFLTLDARVGVAGRAVGGVLSPGQREVVIDRAMAVPEAPVPLEDLKIIVLMVFWSLGEEPDALILDELFVDPEDRLIH